MSLLLDAARVKFDGLEGPAVRSRLEKEAARFLRVGRVTLTEWALLSEAEKEALLRVQDDTDHGADDFSALDAAVEELIS